MGEKANVYTSEDLRAMVKSKLPINYDGFWKMHVVEMLEVAREEIRELEKYKVMWEYLKESDFYKIEYLFEKEYPHNYITLKRIMRELEQTHLNKEVKWMEEIKQLINKNIEELKEKTETMQNRLEQIENTPYGKISFKEWDNLRHGQIKIYEQELERWQEIKSMLVGGKG